MKIAVTLKRVFSKKRNSIKSHPLEPRTELSSVQPGSGSNLGSEPNHGPPNSPMDSGTRKWLFYTFLGMITDALDIILTSVIPDKRPQRSIIVSKFYPLDLLHPPV